MKTNKQTTNLRVCQLGTLTVSKLSGKCIAFYIEHQLRWTSPSLQDSNMQLPVDLPREVLMVWLAYYSMYSH